MSLRNGLTWGSATVDNDIWQSFSPLAVLIFGIFFAVAIMFAIPPFCAFTSVNNYKFFVILVWVIFILGWSVRNLQIKNPIRLPALRTKSEFQEE